MVTTETKYLSCAETAKLVRAALHKNFPGVKFTARSDVYSGGASIDVRWVLGPTTKEVDAIAGRYESASFDGSIDMETSYSHWLKPDGDATIESGPGTEGSMGYIPKVEPQPQPEGAVKVHFGAHYVSCQRSLTENYRDEMDLRRQVARDMCELQRIEYKGDNTVGLFGAGDSEQVDQHAWRLLDATHFDPGEVYAGVRYEKEGEKREEILNGFQVPFVILKKKA